MPPLHLTTILSHSPSSLLSQITRLSSKYGGKGHTVLFALSSNFPVADDLQAVVNGLNAFNKAGDGKQASVPKDNHTEGHTMGCLVDSFSSTSLAGSSTHNGPSKAEELLSCSIGIFDSSRCVPYRSELLGRTQTQVGKWHAFRKKAGSPSSLGPASSRLGQGPGEWEPDWVGMEGSSDYSASMKSEVDWERIWNRSSSNVSSSSNLDLLPQTLRSIDPSKIQALVTLSSPRPDTLTDVLSKAIPNCPSLTLIASPTHFITGRSVTLFLDGQIYGEGSIGLALLNSSNKKGDKELFSHRTEFLGVKYFSNPMVITAREGNMINELDASNPTKLLIQAIESAGLSPSSSANHYFKDDELFALGVVTPDGQISRTYRITAGDPSSRGGSLSLGAPVAPEVGTVVQFLHFPSSLPVEIPSTAQSHKQIAFLTVSEPHLYSSSNSNDSSINSDVQILADTFVVPSTQGFVFAPGPTSASVNEPMWTCSLPGGSVVFDWDES